MREDVLTIKEVGKYLNVTERTLYRLAQEGKIPAFKVGASWRFRRADIDAWSESRTSGTTRGDGSRVEADFLLPFLDLGSDGRRVHTGGERAEQVLNLFL